jgi:hypothetical protein
VSLSLIETINGFVLKIDEVVKSRHSRLSGIVVFYNILIKDDSGQAGMTSKEGYPTFYESIKIAGERLIKGL